MEEQILHFCLKNIKKNIFIALIFSFLIFVLYSLNLFYFKDIKNNEYIHIFKGVSLSNISKIILNNNSILDIYLYTIYLNFYNKYFDKIKYGEFYFSDNNNLIEVTSIISKPSNVFYKLTVIEGWEEYQLKKYFEDNFNEDVNIEYNQILADTYRYSSTDDTDKILDLMIKTKNDYFEIQKNNPILNLYSIDEIITIGSLVEKEGIDLYDKRLISSVIFNRLKKNMKLQIDATTIFSITRGKYKFDRKLTYKDLKKIDPYNTYIIKGLPPKPISYVGIKTIDIVLENYKSDYLFYFFNDGLNKHIFSKTFEEHNSKLIKYRNEQ